MEQRALLIGIGEYLHGYNDLTETVDNDVRLVHESLSTVGVLAVQRVGSRGQVVSYSDLRSVVAKFLTSAPANSDLLIYYSGHGHTKAGITYLVPSDAHPELPDSVSYLVGLTFDDELKASPARSVCFVIDACRTPIDDDESNDPINLGDDTHSVKARTTIFYASGPGEAARILQARGGPSLFTQAFTELIVSTNNRSSLDQLREKLQETTNQLAANLGLDITPTIQVIAGPDVDMEKPLQFFTEFTSPTEGCRWTTVLEKLINEVDDGNAAVFKRVTAILDRRESEAPKFENILTLSRWFDPMLPNRIAKASRLLLRRTNISFIEKLLVLGIVGSLETVVRQQELASASRPDQHSTARLAIISPQLVDAYPTYTSENQKLLVTWCQHILSLRESIAGITPLLAPISEIVATAVGNRVIDRNTEVARYLIDCLNQEFLGRDTGEQAGPFPMELIPPTATEGSVTVDGRKVAALVHLIWLLAADTRILLPELGLGLIQDEVAIESALGSMSHLDWIDLGEVVDLKLSTYSAPLDQALRALTMDITSAMVSLSQPGRPLNGMNIPMAATATRLGPKEGAFRLPHIRFELSAAETHELLMGTNLYGNARVAIREIYQNAVDACMYRRWRIWNVSPQALNDWVPEIVFSSGTTGTQRWIECRDNGVGMSDYELRESFAKVGKRFRDLPEFLQETKDWNSEGEVQFRPISQFGIGVLSYFMIADKVVILTARSDRNGHLGDPLEVRISNAAGLFRLSKQQATRPPGGGTIVRLYLRPEFQDIDLTAALNEIIGAPTVYTRLQSDHSHSLSKSWEPEQLYDSKGVRVEALAVSDLGIYFHDGNGRILINGIPLYVMQDDVPRRKSYNLRGVTVSLDSRCKPRLRVDRGSLISLDAAALQTLMIEAASRVTDWQGVSVLWLLNFFLTEPTAARTAYGCLRSIDLPSGIQADWTLESTTLSGGSKVLEDLTQIPTSQIGISPLDYQILMAGMGDSAARRDKFVNPLIRERRRLLSRAGRKPKPGFPKNDDKLVLLFIPYPYCMLDTIIDGILDIPVIDREVLTPDSSGVPSIRSTSPSHSAGEFIGSVPFSLRMACRIASQLKVSLGAAALYMWSVNFLFNPRHLRLTQAATGIVSSIESKSVFELVKGSLGEVSIFSLDPDQLLVSTLTVAFRRGEGPQAQPEDVERYINLSEVEREIFRKSHEIAPEVREIIERILRTGGRFPRTNYIYEWQNAFMRIIRAINAEEDLEDKNDIVAQVTRLFEPIMVSAPDAQYPASQSRQQPTDLSPAALMAVSATLDPGARWFESSVPAFHIAYAALSENVSPESIASELEEHGFLPDVPGNWRPFLEAAELMPEDVATDADNNEYEYGKWNLCNDLSSLGELCSFMGTDRVKQLAISLCEAGIATAETQRIAQTEIPRTSLMLRHEEVLSGKFPLSADVNVLVRLAVLESITLGEALNWLLKYKPLIEPNWQLPYSLPEELASRAVSPQERYFFVDTSPGGMNSHRWWEKAVQASALSALPLNDVVGGVLPLMEAVGVDTSELRSVVTLGSEPFVFDDLLIIGSLQAWPNLPLEGRIAASKPFCLYPDVLHERAERLSNSWREWTMNLGIRQ